MSMAQLLRSNEGPLVIERKSEVETDAGLLKGALSREQNYQTQLQDQLILQDYLQFRKLTQESCKAPTSPIETGQIGQVLEARVSQLNINPGIQGNSQISPLNFGYSEVTQTQHHKNSAATSKMTSLTATNLYNTINYIPNSKSTAVQTPQTYTNLRAQGQDSNRKFSALRSDEDDIRIFRQSPEVNEDTNENIGQITLSFQKKSQSQPPSQSFSASRLRNQNDSSYNLAPGAISQIPLFSQGHAEGQDYPMSQSNAEENIQRASKELEMEDLNLVDPSKGRKESGAYYQSSNFNNQRKSRFSGARGPNTSPLIKSALPQDILKHMKIMQHAHLFMSKLKSYTLHSNFQKLKEIHFNLIGDVSAFFTSFQVNEEDSFPGRKKSGVSQASGDMSSSRRMQNSQQQKLKKNSIKPLLKKATKVFKQIPVFDPNSFLFIIWDIIMLLIQFMVCIMVPFGVSFQVDWNFLGQSMFNVKSMILIFFLIDMFITLNRGVYVSGIAVLDRKIILKKYVNEILFVDIITIISLANINTYISLLILVRLSYIGIIISRLDDHFQVRMRFSNFSQMFFMICKIVIIAHFCACGLYLVTRLSMEVANEEESMLTQSYFKKGDWEDQYINCLYFTLITMSTVGYGDITPKNNYEKSYVMVMTMLSSAIFGYVVNTVGAIFLNIAQRRASFEQKKFDITNYMNIRSIPKQIQMRTIKFLEYTQLEKNDTHLKGETIIESLPLQLSAEIKQEFYGKILHGCKLLSTNFSNSVINKIALKMKEVSLAPGQFLFQQGQKDNKLYFLLEGNLSVMIKGKNEVLTKVASIEEKGAMIGQQIHQKKLKYQETLTLFAVHRQRSFFCDQVRSKWIKCEKSSNFAFIEFSELKEVLLHFPQDYEVFCKLKDTFIFEGKTADTPCASCEQFSHNIEECPLIHLRFNRLKIIFAEQYTKHQERQKTAEFHRKLKKKKFYDLFDMKNVRTQLRKIRINKIKEQLSKSIKASDISLVETASFNLNFQEEILTYEALADTEKDMKFFKGVPEIIFESVDSQDEGQLIGDTMGINLSEKYEQSEDESDEELTYSDEDSKGTLKLGGNLESDAPTVEKLPPIVHQQQQLSQQPVQEMMDTLTVGPINPSSQNAADRNSFSSSNVLSGTSSKTDHANHLAGGQQKTSLLARNLAQLEENYNTTEAKKFIPPTIQNMSYNENIKDKEDSQTALRLNSQSSIQSSRHDRQPTLTIHRQTSMQSIQPYASALNPLLKDNQNSISNNSLANQGQFTNEQIIKIINSALLSQPSQLGSNANQQQSFFGGTMTSRRRSIQFAKIARAQMKQKSVTIEKQKTHLIHSGTQNTLIDQQFDNMQKQKMQELYFYDFEQPKKMIKYFPMFNMLNVIGNFNKIQKIKNYKKAKNENTLTLGGGSQGQLSPERGPIRIVSPTRRRRDRKSSHSIDLFARSPNQRDSILVSN